MKKGSLLFALLLFGMSTLTAQATYNTIFYTENGERFWVILNGVRQNEAAATNVKVSDLNAPMYKLKVIFEETALGEFDKNLMLSEESAEITYRIFKNKKEKYVARFYTATPLAQAPPPAPNQEVVVFSVNNTLPANPFEQSTTISSTTTTTTQTNSNSMNGEGMNGNVNINMGGFGINMDVNINDNDGWNEMPQTETQSTTISTTTTTTSSGGFSNTPPPPPNVPTGACAMAMSLSDFSEAKRSIASKTFSDSKMTIAKQITGANCLMAAQVKEITDLFDYEADRLEYAIFAYKFTYDPNAYFKVNDAFEFESSIEELNDAIGR